MPPLTGHLAVAATAALAAALTAPTAHAASRPCPAAGRPWVQLVVENAGPAVAQERTIEHMRAELAPSGIDVCTDARPGAPPALATVRLTASDGSTVDISAEVVDAVTSKELARSIDLSTTPPDAHALTIALGATELLRASWIEIELASAPAGDVPVPPEVEADVARERRRGPAGRPSTRVAVGLALAGEEFSGGLRELGLDLRATGYLSRRLALGARFGVRGAGNEEGRFGSVATSGWIAGVAATAPLTPLVGRAGAGLVARADALALTFRGHPTEASTGTRRGGTALSLSGGIASWVRLTGGLRFEVEALAGGAPRGLAATDGTAPLVSAGGILVAGSLGLAQDF